MHLTPITTQNRQLIVIETKTIHCKQKGQIIHNSEKCIKEFRNTSMVILNHNRYELTLE